MKILILAVHFEVTGARYIADAFTKLGHDVRHDGRIADLEDAWGVKVDPKYKWVSNCECTWELTVPIKGWKPDLIIIADTITIAMITKTHPFYEGIPIVVWTQDNHVRNVRHPIVSHYFLAHYHGLAQPVTQPDETWLPCAADTDVFTPSIIPWDEREYDACLVGVMYPARLRLVERLRAEGFKIFAGTGLVYEEYQQAYANSRASLCVSVAGDVAQRIFETASIGCLVITDLLRDLEDSVTNAQLGLTGIVSSGFAVNNLNNIEAMVDQCKRYIRGEYDTSDIESAKQAAKQLQNIVRAKHKWTDRAQVVVDWFNKEYQIVDDFQMPSEDTISKMEEMINNSPTLTEWSDKSINATTWSMNSIPNIRKPFLNLGCGTTHLPSAKPAGHEAVDDAIYEYPLWLNVDKVDSVGADKVFDLFTYPWPLEDNSFDGALLAHIVEHIPHGIKTDLPRWCIDGDWEEGGALEENLLKLQDGWYAFFSELYRVLTPGAIVHIVSPYGFSDGGITDPSHTRYLTINTFTHSMTPEVSDGSTFKYNNGGINFQLDNVQYRMTPYAQAVFNYHRQLFSIEVLLGLYNNICYDFYLRLKVVK